MGLFDIFKTQWSAGKMTPDDRKKLFWYLKRRTSYTAWKRAADAFDAFAVIFKKQIVEEPHAKGLMDGTYWEPYYSEILKAQVLYEQGLELLLQGDRNVWLYNDRGILGDAGTIANSWYSELVNNGARGDHFYDGKYVDEMTDAIKVFDIASRDAGYIQSMMADAPAPECWTTFWHDTFAKLPIPGQLPDVPIPTSEVLIKTNDEVAVFGIYEPQVKDGCMNYLLAGAPAPKLEVTDGTYVVGQPISVTWRLIWEDTRYFDGAIPEEESLYFPIETKIAKPAVVPTLPDSQPSAATGEPCPQSGNWVVLDDINGKQAFQKGERLPQYQGRDVIWLLVSS
ncbi:hypothetical protein CFter6_2862 [Collimonas fungivorans]|uniref:Immunity protein 72 of polymorphic toxin system n=2 Tax=Collimonas fungivorans TaxID=158899 RepID=A0A127PCG9_9BURK|nr:hypothetical protein CFter6_2862 [Collimonas fungivorans]